MMLNIYILLLSSFNVVFGYQRVNTFTEDYCWKDYNNGKVPTDALVGGKDINGDPVYIGQVLHEDKLIPGQIYTNDAKIYYEWAAKPYATSKNVKILCSENPEAFEWISAKREEVSALAKSKVLVQGGYEPNYFTFIGRAFGDGETNVGKVICGLDDCLALFTSQNNKTRENHVFQILAHKSFSIDVRLKR